MPRLLRSVSMVWPPPVHCFETGHVRCPALMSWLRVTSSGGSLVPCT